MNGAVGHHDKYKGTIDCMTQIVKQGGPKALYRGVHLFALKEMLVAFTQVQAYDILFCNFMEKKTETSSVVEVTETSSVVEVKQEEESEIPLDK